MFWYFVDGYYFRCPAQPTLLATNPVTVVRSSHTLKRSSSVVNFLSISFPCCNSLPTPCAPIPSSRSPPPTPAYKLVQPSHFMPSEDPSSSSRNYPPLRPSLIHSAHHHDYGFDFSSSVSSASACPLHWRPLSTDLDSDSFSSLPYPSFSSGVSALASYGLLSLSPSSTPSLRLKARISRAR